MCLKTLINENLKMSHQTSDEANFFEAAVKVAHISEADTRKKITADLAQALNCDVASLMFLFDSPMSKTEQANDTAFPNFRDAMLLEAAE